MFWTSACFIGARAGAEMTDAADDSPTTRGGRFLVIPIVGDTRKGRRRDRRLRRDRSMNIERVHMLGLAGLPITENGYFKFMWKID